MYLRHSIDAHHTGTGIQCAQRTTRDWPFDLHAGGTPTMFIGGRVRTDIQTVRVEFADGTHRDLRPTRGYVLYAVPENRLAPARAPIRVEARNADGQVLQTLHLRL
jgi:hypothetical protein